MGTVQLTQASSNLLNQKNTIYISSIRKMIFKSIQKKIYNKLNGKNEKHENNETEEKNENIMNEKRNDEYKKCKIEVCEKSYPCLDCFLDELKEENWDKSPENLFLKIAFEKKIVQNIYTSIKDLNKEDKKSVEYFLAMYYLKYDYCLW